MAVGIEETHEEKKEMKEMAIEAARAPPKETGMTKAEYETNVQTLANLEAIRVNQFIPFTLFVHRDGDVTANDTTNQKVEFEVFEPGYIYIVTSICAYAATVSTPQIRIGIKDGDTYTVFESATVGNASDSVEYVGQLMCKESDIIYAEFWNVGQTESLYVAMNGYKIRR